MHLQHVRGPRQQQQAYARQDQPELELEHACGNPPRCECCRPCLPTKTKRGCCCCCCCCCQMHARTTQKNPRPRMDSRAHAHAYSHSQPQQTAAQRRGFRLCDGRGAAPQAGLQTPSLQRTRTQAASATGRRDPATALPSSSSSSSSLPPTPPPPPSHPVGAFARRGRQMATTAAFANYSVADTRLADVAIESASDGACRQRRRHHHQRRRGRWRLLPRPRGRRALRAPGTASNASPPPETTTPSPHPCE